MMQDMIKAYLVGIAGAAGISTWKLIKRYWRILTLLSVSVLALMSISVITQEGNTRVICVASAFSWAGLGRC